MESTTTQEIEEQFKRNWFRDPWLFLATGFGIGWTPLIAGTIASLLFGLAWWFLLGMTDTWVRIVAVVFVVGLALSTLLHLVQKYGYCDAKCIVIDEIAGVCVALCLLPMDFWVFWVAVALFRLFDVWKPWPIGLVDKKMQDAWGILLDDLIAGAMSGVIAFATWKVAIAT